MTSNALIGFPVPPIPDFCQNSIDFLRDGKIINQTLANPDAVVIFAQFRRHRTQVMLKTFKLNR
ncbi:MAG: hypothetical protein F6K16_27630 [Symploca sp. SIO2B6]|nr:hypothetical protein [Symploca sp. SIO2B6]